MTTLNKLNRKLYIWPNQILYLGINPTQYREHTIVSDKLIVCLEGEIIITLENGEKVTSRSCLLKTGPSFNKTSIHFNNATIAIYYLAPLTQDYSSLKNVMRPAKDGVYYNHPEENLLINDLIMIRNTTINPKDTLEILRKFIIPIPFKNIVYKPFDRRIIKVVNRLRREIIENTSLRDLAADVHLSESRLEKLFKEQIGIPITKYRLKYRVFIGILNLVNGSTITESAMAAGFASASHFSKSFTAINGITPSDAFIKKPRLQVLISDELKSHFNSTDSPLHDIFYSKNKMTNNSDQNAFNY